MPRLLLFAWWVLSSTAVPVPLSTTLDVWVFNPDGEPAAGATLWCWEAVGDGPAPAVETGLTDEDGRLEIDCPVEKLVELWAEGPEMGGGETVHQAGGGVEVGPVVLELQRLAPVRGRVVDADGHPVAGARITAALLVSGRRLPPEVRERLGVTTDEEGGFALRSAIAGDSVALRVEAEGFLSHWRLVLPVSKGQAGHREVEPIELARAGRFAVRVTTPDGTALEGAQVDSYRLDQSSYRGVVQYQETDAKGRVMLEGRVPGVRYVVTSRVPGYASGRVEAIAAPSDGPPTAVGLVLTPRERRAVSVGVVDIEGDPVADAEVQLRSKEESFSRFETLTTDADGRTPPAEVEIGRYEASAAHPDHLAARRELEVKGGAGVLEATLTFPESPWRMVEVDLLVEGQEGPVARAEVELTTEPPCCERQVGRTDEDGRLRLRLRSGAHRLSVSSAAAAPYASTVVVGTDGELLHIRLAPGAAVSGTISGLLPVELARAFVSADGKTTRVVEGRYKLHGLAAGPTEVHLVAGDRQVRAAVDLVAGEAVDLPLHVEQGHTVRGTLTVDGSPVAGISVELSSLPGDPHYLSFSSPTDAYGRFALEHVPVGDYIVTTHVVAGNYRRRLDVSTDVELDLELSAGSVRGVVVDAESGTAMDGAEVSAHGEIIVSHGRRWESRSDDRGGFVLDGLLADQPWTLVASAPGYESARVTVEVPAEVTLSLQPARRLEVRLLSPGLRRSVELNLWGDEVQFWEKHFDVDGEGRGGLEGVPAGSFVYRLIDGCSVSDGRLEIPGPPLEVVMEPAGCLVVEVPELAGDEAAAIPPTLRARLVAPTGRPTRTEVCDQRGRNGVFRLEGLSAGRWELEVVGERVWRGTAEVVAGQTVRLQLLEGL